VPVPASLRTLLQRVMGVGEPVVGAGLVDWLAQLSRQPECSIVVGDGRTGIAGRVLQPAKSVQSLELEVRSPLS
jgi:hypothetical protein